MGGSNALINVTRVGVSAFLLVLLVVSGPAWSRPYFDIETGPQWMDALSMGKISPVSPAEWGDYMIQWDLYREEGDPYPVNTFVAPELYVWGGGGGGGTEPEDAGLVMTWGALPGPASSFSSAWRYDYLLDPDLSNSTITLTVTAPQFDLVGSQVNNVSFGIRDINGCIRSWHWRCGPGWPIQWNVPTQISINTSMVGLAAANPVASGFMNNPGFDLTRSQTFIVDENATWVGGPMPVPPPGQMMPAMWNYWHNILVTPAIPPKIPNPLKWSQPVVQYIPSQPPLFLGWDEQSLYQLRPIAADDWKCETNQPVTDIHWWGSFLGWSGPEPPEMPLAFHIGIWTDIPDDPQNPEDFSHPGKMIWEHYCDNFQWNFAGYDHDPRNPSPEMFTESCFQFTQYLNPEDWFYQQQYGGSGTIFWLSIAAVYRSGYQPAYPWGWKTRPHFFHDDAVRIMQTYGPDGMMAWPPHVSYTWALGSPIEWQGESWDLAFELTTQEVEQPENELGDAPDSSNNSGLPMLAYPGVQANYPTVFQTGSPPYGPIHLNPTALAWLGWAVTKENEADIGPDQDPTNNIDPPNNAPNLDLADDGVVFPIAMPHCAPTSFQYVVNVVMPNQPIYVNVWCDWNRDGDWDDTMQCPGGPAPVFVPEWAVQNQTLNFPTPGIYTVSTPQFYCWHPQGSPGPMWMRVTLSDSRWQSSGGPGYGGSGPSAGYVFGETEDYLFTPLAGIGTLTVKYNHTVYDHFWWRTDPDPDNEMISILGSSDGTENIFWNTVTVQASGSGNDATDITAVKVWQDNDNDGKVSSGDTLLGTATYAVDNGTAVVALLPSPVIPANGAVHLVISYTMNPGAAVGSTYHVDVTGASGTGQTSGQPVTVNITPNPLVGATKTVGLPPITIGEAKRLPIGTQFLLDSKICTANFQPNMSLIYIEEKSRAAGIGVLSNVVPIPAVGVWDRVSVLGTCVLINQSELVVSPQVIIVTPGIAPPLGSPPFALGMNNKYTGGGLFGGPPPDGQPGLYDDVWQGIPSYGLNNVGLLVTTWGRVTYHEAVFPWRPYPPGLPPFNPPIPYGDMFWINDGSNLSDGFLDAAGGRLTGIAVYCGISYPGLPNPGEYWAVTGIVRAIPSPFGFPGIRYPVRLLVIRSAADLKKIAR